MITVNLKRIENKFKAAEEKLLENLVAATPIDTGRARAGWKLKDHRITNDVEYVRELNHGTSKQAPSRYIEQTIYDNGFIMLEQL